MRFEFSQLKHMSKATVINVCQLLVHDATT